MRVQDLTDDRHLIYIQVFGVAPPQTLYHTRRSPSPVVNPIPNKVSGWTSPGESLPAVTGLHNPNRSSYTKPKKSKSKDHRPGTSESIQALLPKGRSGERRTSIIYTHYQDSLNSLNDIIDRVRYSPPHFWKLFLR